MKNKKLVEAIALDNILNPNNMDNVTLFYGDNEVEFEQLAFVEYNENFYTVLKPFNVDENIDENDVYIFEIINNEDKEPYIKLEENEDIKSYVAATYLNSIESVKKSIKN